MNPPTNFDHWFHRLIAADALEIKVHVVERADRKYLNMRYTDPITGKPVRRSTGTTNRREAEKKAVVWATRFHFRFHPLSGDERPR